MGKQNNNKFISSTVHMIFTWLKKTYKIGSVDEQQVKTPNAGDLSRKALG